MNDIETFVTNFNLTKALWMFAAALVVWGLTYLKTRLWKNAEPMLASAKQLLDGDQLFLERLAKRLDNRALMCTEVSIQPSTRDPGCVHISFIGAPIPLTISWMPVSVSQFINIASRMLVEHRWRVTLTDGEDGLTAAAPTVSAPTIATHANAA